MEYQNLTIPLPAVCFCLYFAVNFGVPARCGFWLRVLGIHLHVDKFFHQICNCWDLLFALAVIWRVIVGEGWECQDHLLTKMLQCTGYKYFDMGYLSNLHWIFVMKTQGHVFIILQHSYTLHMIKIFVIECLIFAVWGCKWHKFLSPIMPTYWNMNVPIDDRLLREFPW